jgi:fructokinase
MTAGGLRLGIDLGGTKIEGAILDRTGGVIARHRIPAPRGDYAATIEAIADVIGHLETGLAEPCPVGIGLPGSLSPKTGLVQNANSVWLNDRPLDRDLSGRLGRPLRFANDANCFALSEATDGAGHGAHTVFGVILGTGCGGGIVIDGKLVDGPRGIGGEWGHTPLPWPTAAELAIAPCWCSRQGCLETWISGTGLANDHARVTGHQATGEDIVVAAGAGDGGAQASLDRHAHRLARGLAMIVNIIDPDVIVLGGGLSALPHLYETMPRLMAPYIFSADPNVSIHPPRWGDSSGVRGAAWLWP